MNGIFFCLLKLIIGELTYIHSHLTFAPAPEQGQWSACPPSTCHHLFHHQISATLVATAASYQVGHHQRLRQPPSILAAHIWHRSSIPAVVSVSSYGSGHQIGSHHQLCLQKGPYSRPYPVTMAVHPLTSTHSVTSVYSCGHHHWPPSGPAFMTATIESTSAVIAV